MAMMLACGSEKGIYSPISQRHNICFKQLSVISKYQIVN